MAARAPKAPKLKGPALTHSSLDALLDAYGTHTTEALAGRADAAVRRGLDALAAPDMSPHYVFRITDTARTLARAGHYDAARRLADAVGAIPDPPWGPGDTLAYWQAARAAHPASVYVAIGDKAAANAALDEALTHAPAWTFPPASPYAPTLHQADAAGLAAFALLDLGRDAEADAILANLYTSSIRAGLADAARRGDGARLERLGVTARPGQLSLGEQIVGTLLDHGHLALADRWMRDALDSPYLQPSSRVRWRLQRSLADSVRDFDAAFVDTARQSSSERPNDVGDALLGLVQALSLRRARSADGLDGLLDALSEALTRIATTHGASHAFWQAVRALHDGGRDVTPWIAKATSPDAQAQAVIQLLPVARTDEGTLRATLVQWALAIDPSTVAGPPGALARRALVTLLRAGERDAATTHALTAAKALRSNPQELGELAFASMVAGDLALAWEIASHATKAKKDATLAQMRWYAAAEGEIDLYATVCLAYAPDAHTRIMELTAILERIHEREAASRVRTPPTPR